MTLILLTIAILATIALWAHHALRREANRTIAKIQEALVQRVRDFDALDAQFGAALVALADAEAKVDALAATPAQDAIHAYARGFNDCLAGVQRAMSVGDDFPEPMVVE